MQREHTVYKNVSHLSCITSKQVRKCFRSGSQAWHRMMQFAAKTIPVPLQHV